MPDHLIVVMSNVEAGREDDFNEWYTDEHVVDVVEKLPGVVTAQRFEPPNRNSSRPSTAA